MFRLKALQTLLCISLSANSANAAYHFTCPNDAGTNVVIPAIDIIQAASSPAGGITVDNTATSRHLCTLTLQDASNPSTAVSIPVARSFDGGDWEIAAGPLAQTLPSPTCSSSVCTLVGLPPPDTEQDEMYVLTSFSHTGFGEEAEAARFLEQATFGPTRAAINSLVSSGGDKYKMWIKDQVENVPMSSHREYYRRRANPVRSRCCTNVHLIS